MSIEHASTEYNANASDNSAVAWKLGSIAIVWFGVSAALGFSGFFAEYPGAVRLFVLVPVVIFVILFVVSRGVQAWAFGIDIKALVFFQAVRAGGIAFLAAYAVGRLNGTFALWAGGIDAVVGLSAPFAAQYLVPTRTRAQQNLLLAWMALGLLDFVVAIPLAALVRANDPNSMLAVLFPPLSMITTFAVPIAIMDYLILGAHLWRQRKQMWSTK